MDIMLLGPLIAQENGVSVTPIARKPRQVLSLLALEPGSVVTVPSLIEELWGNNPPASALATLQTYILQVRRGIAVALGSNRNDSAKGILRTCHGGYRLDVDPSSVDVYTYKELAAAGKRAHDNGDFAGASDLLGRALGVWRGEMLVDVHVGPRMALDVTQLNEARLGVLEARIESDLRLSRHKDLLAELSMLTARHPMNESFCAQFMIALHRSGRTSQALEAFTKLRQTLVSELGVEPSRRLHNLQQSILRSGGELDRSRPRTQPR